MIEQVFILHHTHVDLGYTGPREQVCRELAAMVDHVIDLVDAHASRPEPQQFRWIHEVSRPVLEYLGSDGSRKEKLFDHIRRGLVELTALYVNPTELFDKDSFELTIDYACQLAREYNLPLTTAMFNDCPGIAWSVVDMLSQRGVKYLATAPDFIMSYPLELERPFYWIGPEGGRLLTWFADWRNNWYGEGRQVLKLHKDPVEASSLLLNYIQQLHGEGYRWKGLAINFGYDNQPPEPSLVNFVRYFNARHDQVRVCMATARDFFEFMEEKHAGQFEEHRGAWPDWWTNGHGSAAFEVACSRRTKSHIKRSVAMSKMTAAPLDEPLLKEATDAMVLFDEHTWGHTIAGSCPWAAVSRLDWAVKRSFAISGLDKARRVEENIALTLAQANKVIIANPFNDDWHGVVQMQGPRSGRKAPCLVDLRSRQEIIGQRDRLIPKTESPQDTYVMKVPAGAVREFKRSSSNNPGMLEGLDNKFFTLAYDNETGNVQAVLDKSSGVSLYDPDAKWGFAEIIHERINRGSREKLYDIHAGMLSHASKRPCPNFIRKAGHVLKRTSQIMVGPVYNSLVTKGRLPGVSFIREIRLYHAIKRIDVVLKLDKQIETCYESLYLAFPFFQDRPETWIENAGAVYRAGIDQLPGSAVDWYGVGHYVAVSGSDRTIVLSPIDCAVVQIGDIQTGKWAKRMENNNGHVYSWLMNNMWPTNFPVYQEGRVELRWALTVLDGPFDRSAAEQFSRHVGVGVVVADKDQAGKFVDWAD